MSYNPRLAGLASTVEETSGKVAQKVTSMGDICQTSAMFDAFDKGKGEAVEKAVAKVTDAMNKATEGLTSYLQEIDKFLQETGDKLDLIQERMLDKILEFVEEEIVSRKHAIEDAIAAEQALVSQMKNSLATVANAVEANRCVQLAKSAKDSYKKVQSGEFKEALEVKGENFMEQMKNGMGKTDAMKAIESIDAQVAEREKNIVKPLPSIDEMKRRVGWYNPSGNNLI